MRFLKGKISDRIQLRPSGLGSYERAGVVSDQEAKEMFVLAANLRDGVEKWLRLNQAELL